MTTHSVKTWKTSTKTYVGSDTSNDLLFRYHEHGELRERLMLNHLICLFNVFGHEATMKMLDFKIKDEGYKSSIKTMLIYLKYVEEGFQVEVSIDETLATTLRNI